MPPGAARIEDAKRRILADLARGPLTASELSRGSLRSVRPCLSAGERDEAIRGLIGEGRIAARMELFGYRQLRMETYRLTAGRGAVPCG